MASVPDEALRKSLLDHLDRAVKAGEPVVDPFLLKQIKSICRQSDAYVEAAYHFLCGALAEEHSQMRLSALQISHELFVRSHRFRELLVANFKEFVECVVDVKVRNPLPPPLEAAKALNIFALQAIEEWHNRFGATNARLRVAYNYLRRQKGDDFANLDATLASRSLAEAAERERIARVKKKRLDKAIENLRLMAGEIENCCQAFDTACGLLVPDPDDFWIAGFAKEEGGKSRSGEEDSGEEMEDEGVAEEAADDAEEAMPCESEDGDGDCVATRKKTKETTEMGGGKSQGGETTEHASVEGGSERVGRTKSKRKTEKDKEEGAELEKRRDNREHGLLGTFCLDIPVEHPQDTLLEDEDNVDLVQALRDQRALLERAYLPLIRGWARVFGAEEGEKDRLKRCLDLKAMVQERLRAFDGLKIRGQGERTEKDDGEEGEESDFEDVEDKEGYEDVPDFAAGPSKPPSQSSAPAAAEPSTSDARSARVPSGAPDPSTTEPEPGPSCPPAQPLSPEEVMRRQEMAAKAPRVKFGQDLISWGEEAEAVVLSRSDALHRFWSNAEPESVIIPKSEVKALQHRRAVTFPGEFCPVDRECRAPLPTGELCQRMDRHKCPFHGRIIDRDAIGVPVEEGERARLKAEEELAKAVERRQALLAERRAKRATKLLDLRRVKDTPSNRIAKRVLKPSALKRVGEVMNAIEERKRLEKFGQQFHYILKNSRRP